MWFTTRLVLFTAIVTGVVHTVTVSAFPYGVRGSRSTASSKPDHPNDQKGLSTREYTPLTGDSTNKEYTQSISYGATTMSLTTFYFSMQPVPSIECCSPATSSTWRSLYPQQCYCTAIKGRPAGKTPASGFFLAGCSYGKG
ncbi:hypothetical protein BC835DRAFT_850903 [Cytidiella melzeri]|nr:hypothetical protein BC835DRAFT_850903 [Cytidiella melzeri]